MTRRWMLICFLLPAFLAGCASEAHREIVHIVEAGELHLKDGGFLYQSFAGPLSGPDSPYAEQARLDGLAEAADEAGMCGDRGYQLVQRYVTDKPITERGGIPMYDIYYQARCR